MATITSLGSGLWSVAGTWDAGVPLDGDTVIIASGHIVTFDVDQSAFVTGISLTITGTLIHTTAAGTFCLFLKAGASITGAGTWNVGTQANPIPFASKHTITGASGWYVDGLAGLTMTVYGAEPTYTYVRLTDGESAAATVLRVDTDVTGDLWADGDTITIANINKAKNVEERTIAVGGIAAGSITITAGLTASKIAGSYVCLVTRNVKFISVGSGSRTIYRVLNLTVGGGMWYGVNKWLFEGCTGLTILGGAFTYHDIVLYSSSVLFSAGVITNCSNVINNTQGGSLTGGLVAGVSTTFNLVRSPVVAGAILAGNNHNFFSCISPIFLSGSIIGSFYGFATCPGIRAFGGSIIGCGDGIRQSSGFINNVTLQSNSYDLNQVSLVLYNCLLASASEHGNYDLLGTENYTESFDHDQVAGAFKAWTKGGITEKQAVVYPTGYDNAFQTALASATSEGFWQREVSVSAGQSVNFDLWLRKDAAMAYLPRVYIFLKRETDPFAGGTPIHSFIMTNSVDTWEHDTYTYTNDGSEDEVLIIRSQGKNASGNMYSALTVQVLNVDLTSVLAHLVDIKGASWTAESLASITTLLGTLATSAELAALNDLSPAEIRSALGLAVANLDDQFLNLVAWAAISLDESITAGTIIQIRGNSWTISIEDLVLSDHKQQFAIKHTHRNAAIKPPSPPWTVAYPDADSLIFIDSDTGLLYLNGVAAADPTLGSLSYVGTTLTVTLDPAVTSLLAPGTYTFGIQSVTALGVVSETYGGTFTITADVVRSIT